MGKNSTGGRSAAREAAQARAAELRAAQARKERQRRQMTIAGTVVAVLVIAGAVAAAISLSKGKDTPDPTSTGGGLTSEQVIAKLTGVPAATFDAVGVSKLAPSAIPARLDGAQAVTANGKPKVLYVGAEYCPYCAMERWALVAALSRFGTFQGLAVTSSPPEPSIQEVPTVTFKDSTYTSELLTLDAVETADRRGQPLGQLSDEDRKLFETYASPPYVEAAATKTVPWVLYGGKVTTHGSTVDSALLQGKTATEVANALGDPNSPIAQSILSSANVKTAYLCTLTGNKPANVCTAPGVMQAASKLG